MSKLQIKNPAYPKLSKRLGPRIDLFQLSPDKLEPPRSATNVKVLERKS